MPRKGRSIYDVMAKERHDERRDILAAYADYLKTAAEDDDTLNIPGLDNLVQTIVFRCKQRGEEVQMSRTSAIEFLYQLAIYLRALQARQANRLPDRRISVNSVLAGRHVSDDAHLRRTKRGSGV